MNPATTPPTRIDQLNITSPLPRGTEMRPNSQESQQSISPASRTSVCIGRHMLAATLITVAVVLNAPIAFAGVETIEDQGRRTQTGPKGLQVAVDGIPLVEEQTSPTPSGRSVQENGRLLRARPTQPVSVGLLGCPGCTWVLEAIGGVFVDVDGRREYGGDGYRGADRRDRGRKRLGEATTK